VREATFGQPTARPSGPDRRQLKRFYPHRDLRTRIVALPEVGLLYVQNPKAASSTVMLWLDRLYTGEHSFSTEKSHRDNRLPTAEKIGWEVVSDMLGGSAFRFTFVRNPLGRFESVYHNKVARLGPWRAKVQAILDLPEDRSARVTFEQFLAAVEQEDPLWMNLHWRPQHLNLMHPLVSYDLVGRVETFDREIAVIRRHVNVPEVMVESLNVARTKPDVSVYDGRPDLVRRVEQIYAKDFELYGY